LRPNAAGAHCLTSSDKLPPVPDAGGIFGDKRAKEESAAEVENP